MLHRIPPFRVLLTLQRWPTVRAKYSTRSVPNLRILFCGSDEFSANSLEALIKARDNKALPIQSLDVLCRPPKRTGRGLKNLREVPIVDVASRLGLPVHKIDTFTGWQPPSNLNINLIIAVSFGLLIPARILQSVEHGGLNIHPSLLPDFRGAAPIEHAMLNFCTETGVSLQTLHPTEFDRGILLRQIREPIDPENEELATIKTRLAEKGAQLLIDGLTAGDFLKPYPEIEPPKKYSDGRPVETRKAPKFTSADRLVKWLEWETHDIFMRQKVLGPLWTRFVNRASGQDVETRIIWTGMWKKAYNTKWDPVDTGPAYNLEGETGSLVVPDIYGTGLVIERFTLAGRAETTAKEAYKLLKITDENKTRYF